MINIRKQGAWGLWWLCGLTFGIYYLVWYARINRELCSVLGHDVPSNGRWWSQIVPIYGLVGLAKTAGRVNSAHAAVGSPTRVGSFMTWFLAPAWFASQTRYLQRRVNVLHDVVFSQTRGALAAPGQVMGSPLAAPSVPLVVDTADALSPAPTPTSQL